MNRSRNPSRMLMKRDVWGLSPPSNGYPGSFPLGLLKRMKKEGWWGEKRLWLFSGSFEDPKGTTVDIKPEIKDKHGRIIAHPSVVANCEQLPFDDDAFDFVMLDPPYSELEARKLYDLDYCSIPKVINEAARVTAPGGTMAILHRLIPWVGPWENRHKRAMVPIAVIGVYTISGYTNMRALSIWRKNNGLFDRKVDL